MSDGKNVTVAEHRMIWLQPRCCAGPEGQMWCEDDVGPCECGKPWVPYSLVQTRFGDVPVCDVCGEQREGCPTGMCTGHYEKNPTLELLEALKTAANIIGHPDDAMSKYFAELVARVEGRS